jgi:hypothetical protein
VLTYFFDVRGASLLHDDVQFPMQQLNDSCHALLPKRT